MARAGRQQTEELTPRSARAEITREIAGRHAGERGPLLPILHAVQREHGYVADEDVAEVADVLNLSVAEVHGTVSFYHDFRRTPAPEHTVEVCRAEACQAVGAAELYAAAQDRFAGRHDVEVREIFCFGNCALGPSASVDGRLRGRVTAEDLAAAERGWTP
ncbi:NAD-dependent formate dehydrogenase gamma subunit [Serinicoccus hydrothermalis]|uniref:NAD-dependent formate dehydrogenase gamma subunit n=1 Tax=Serinicoccus hydrothermalis TaxID=1758689 RepID=A0A1B1NDY3_9MICO|nr:NAD(P)H-dependent oxidoreductase subunit E [Serinicoccus hydrothermalis]ANS79633.1 NAD-dependent formate dehydrogenase gamma subunit [Serinicoccus hydrothermalis]